MNCDDVEMTPTSNIWGGFETMAITGSLMGREKNREREKEPDTRAGLRWTGHAFVDVGIAGACAYAQRERPEDLTLNDLDEVSKFMVETYYQAKLGTYLSCVFMNASFVQPNESAAKRQQFIEHYCRAHRAEPDPRVNGLRCVFSGLPATSPLVRTHLPLFSAENIVNFRPGGETFVPAAGVVIVCLLFLPMASVRSEGRLLAVHADDPRITLAFARRYLENNRRLIALRLPEERKLVHDEYEREIPMWDIGKKRYKFADAKGPRSLVVADLTEIAAASAPSELRPRPAALSAYLLSNSGQGPSLEIFHVPSGVIEFVRRAAGATTRAAWNRIATGFRPVIESSGESSVMRHGRRRAARQQIPGRAGWSRNPAFEEICDIFEAGFTDPGRAARWLRKYVLGDIKTAGRRASENDIAGAWSLAELFLGEVLGMNKSRVEAIRSFADKLADWIGGANDRKLLHALTFDKPWELRGALLRAQRESARTQLLFGLDEFANVWLSQEGDEYLVRDLVCLRVVEKLHESGYLTAHPEAVTAAPREEASPPEEVTA